MAQFSINGNSISENQIKSVKMYVSIVRYVNSDSTDSYNVSRNVAKHIVNFMRSVYLCEHPADELDLLDGKLTDACQVVNTVSLTKYDSIKQLISLSIDFDNMLALGYINYIEYANNTLQLSNCQQSFIESKQQRLIKRHSLTDYTLTASNIDKSLSLVVQPQKRINSKAVCQYDLDGNLIAEFESVADAARKTNINECNILRCCNHSQLTTAGFVFRFKDDFSPVTVSYKHKTFESGRDPKMKRVAQYDTDGNLIAIYESMKEAAEAVSGYQSNITFACNGQRKTAYGFVWRYADD